MPDGRRGHNIAMLGAPTSGKTTFLAALSIALNRREHEGQEHEWNVIGVDDASTAALVKLTLMLADERRFPEATALAVELYHWLLVGPAVRKLKRRWLPSKQVPTVLKVGLDLVDASGELASPRWANSEQGKKLVDSILNCDGIVFLFDPVFESGKGKSFFYMYSVLAELARRAANRDDDFDGRLDQYVAICVSKFDDTRVLETAEKLDILLTDPDDVFEFPRVDKADSRDFFRQLCRVLDADNADLVMNALERHFRKDRIRYFVSSAIGFYVDPALGVYDPNDTQNLLPDPILQSSRIRGGIYPINVVEPFLWLAEKLTETKVTW